MAVEAAHQEGNCESVVDAEEPEAELVQSPNMHPASHREERDTEADPPGDADGFPEGSIAFRLSRRGDARFVQDEKAPEQRKGGQTVEDVRYGVRVPSQGGERPQPAVQSQPQGPCASPTVDELREAFGRDGMLARGDRPRLEDARELNSQQERGGIAGRPRRLRCGRDPLPASAGNQGEATGRGLSRCGADPPQPWQHAASNGACWRSGSTT
jgi:hypothetical protein